MDHLALRWNNHRPAFFQLLRTIRENAWQSDVTIACGLQLFKAHRLVLSACSEFFSEILAFTDSPTLVVVLKDIGPGEMQSLLDYMYLGEVQVPQTDLSSLIAAAEALRIKGLAVPDFIATAAATTTTTPVPAAGARPAATTTRVKQEEEEEEEEEDSLYEEEGEEEEEEAYRRGRRRKRLRREGHEDQESKKEPSNISKQKVDNEIYDIEADFEVKVESVGLSDEALSPSRVLQNPTSPNTKGSHVRIPPPTWSDSDMLHPAFLSALGGRCGTEGLSGASSSPIDGMINSSTGFSGTHVIGQEEDSEMADANKPATTITATENLDPDIRPGPQLRILQRGYGCPHCDKTFNDRYKRDRHCLIHTGEKPYKCPCCDYRSSRKDPVVRHIKFKHTNAMNEFLT